MMENIQRTITEEIEEKMKESFPEEKRPSRVLKVRIFLNAMLFCTYFVIL